jgi:hypothetical protein
MAAAAVESAGRMIQIVDGVRIYELREILDERKPRKQVPVSPSAIISPVRFDLDRGWLRADGTPLYAEALRRV